MNGANPIIVVTGGNRGIGFEICRQLAERGAQVILTARKPDAGEQAVKKLATQNLSARFHPLNEQATRLDVASFCVVFLRQGGAVHPASLSLHSDRSPLPIMKTFRIEPVSSKLQVDLQREIDGKTNP